MMVNFGQYFIPIMRNTDFFFRLFLYATSVYCDLPCHGVGPLHEEMGIVISPLHVYLELQTLSQGLTANTQSRLFQFFFIIAIIIYYS